MTSSSSPISRPALLLAMAVGMTSLITVTYVLTRPDDRSLAHVPSHSPVSYTHLTLPTTPYV